MSTMQRAAGASRRLAASTAVVAACRFVRSVILARMLLRSDFGVGATFTLALTFLELLTELSPTKQLVQAREGDSARWQSAAQFMLAVRGAMMAGLLFVLGGPIAELLGAPEAAASFRCLAVVPLLRNLEHLDVTRHQRNLHMDRLATVSAVPEMIGLLAAPPLAWALGDYRAFLGVTLAISLSRTLLSHRLADRPFELSWDPALMRRFMAFGLPLLGNSLLMFLTMHGERVLVATHFDLSTLGAYSAALTLALTPTTSLASLHNAILLPIFSRNQDQRAAFLRNFNASTQITCLVGGALAMTFTLAGSWLIGVVFGSQFLIGVEAAPWIGLMCAVRIVRNTPAMASVALGDTKINFYSNVIRSGAFVAALLMLRQGGPLAWVPIFGFVGEVAAHATMLALLQGRHGVDVREHVKYFASTAALVAAAWAAAQSSWAGNRLPEAIQGGLGLGALGLFAWLFWTDLPRMVRATLSPRHASPHGSAG